jgi:hypothetical protein
MIYCHKCGADINPHEIRDYHYLLGVQHKQCPILKTPKASMSSDNLIPCPFCKEEGFDIEGLKGHLENRECNIYTLKIKGFKKERV